MLEVAVRLVLPAPLPWRFPQIRYRPDPALIFALEPDQRGFSADKLVTINARGLRGPAVPYDRVPGRTRLLFLGDSIIFGFGVSEGDVLGNRVAELLAARDGSVEVINAGVPAYNTDQEITYLEREGFRYHPDWVIVGVCWNDVHDKSGVVVDALGRLTDEPLQPPSALTRVMESAPVYAIRNAIKRSRIIYLALQGSRAIDGLLSPDSDTQTRTEVLEGRDGADVERGWQRIDSAAHRLRIAADTYGFRAMLVTFPIPLTMEHPYPSSSFPRRVREAAAREGFAFLDLEPAFRREYHGHESLFIPYDADHPNGAGHAVAAREIAKQLRDAE